MEHGRRINKKVDHTRLPQLVHLPSMSVSPNNDPAAKTPVRALRNRAVILLAAPDQNSPYAAAFASSQTLKRACRVGATFENRKVPPNRAIAGQPRIIPC